MPKTRFQRLSVLSLIVFLLATILPGGFAAAGTTLTATPDAVEVQVPFGGSAVQTVTIQGASGPLSPSVDNTHVKVTASGSEVKVTVAAGDLPAGTVDIATLTVTDGRGAQVLVPIVINVAATGSGGTAITTVPEQLDLGSVSAGAAKVGSFKVTVNTSGTVSGTVSAAEPWISVAPRVLSTASQTVQVVVKTAGLTAGSTYTGTVKVDAGAAGVVAVPVLVSIPAPSAPPETVTASTFTDVPNNHWALKAIQAMQARKVIAGFTDGTFRPDDLVSREQFAKVMVAALGLPLVTPPAVPSFPDVRADRWSYQYVETARPYLTGYADRLFRPEEPAMREDIAAALALAKGLDKEAPPDPSELDVLFTDANTMSPPALKLLVARAVKAKLLNGFEDRTFRPRASLTRAETATLLYRASAIASPVTKTAPQGPGTGGTPATPPTPPAPVTPPTPVTPPAPPTPVTPPPTTGGPVVTPGPVAPPVPVPGTPTGLGVAPARWPSAADAEIVTLAGGMGSAYADGPVSTAKFQSMQAVTIGPDGAVYVLEQCSNEDCSFRVRKVFQGQVTTVWRFTAHEKYGQTAGNLIFSAGRLWVTYIYNGYLKQMVLRRQGATVDDDQEIDLGSFGDSGYSVNVYMAPATASEFVVAATNATMAYRVAADGTLTRVVDSRSNGTSGAIIAVDEVTGTYYFSWHNEDITSLRLFPRKASDILNGLITGSYRGIRANHRGGFYGFGDGTLYRWAVGEPQRKKLFSLSEVSNDGFAVSAFAIGDWQADATGNIVLLDTENNSIRYIRLFK